MSAYTSLGKEVLLDGAHFADATSPEDAARIAAALGRWLPIESAPKDGTEIDLWGGSGMGCRTPDCVWIKTRSGTGWHTRGDKGWEFLHEIAWEPTHWRTIPDSPVRS